MTAEEGTGKLKYLIQCLEKEMPGYSVYQTPRDPRLSDLRCFGRGFRR